MNCHEVRKLKHDFADGDLAENVGLAVEEHLRECPACAEAVASLARLRALLRASAREQPSEAALRRGLAALARAAGTSEAHPHLAPPLIMTLPELAAFLRVSEQEAHVVAHQIPHFAVAGKMRFRRVMVERWIELQEQRTAAAVSGVPILSLVPDEGAAWALVG